METENADGLPPSPGLIGDRYALDEPIGRGAAATVYLGRDRQTGHTVAVKVLRRELAGSSFSARFLREIRLAAQLRHPSIVSVLDAGEVDGIPFFVMPVFRDGTLSQRLQAEGALPLEEVLRITSELAAALDFAHGYDVLHRDIKPQNVLFDGTHPLLADFGIAKALDEHDLEKLTESGVVLGTPLYMSPEQGGGDAVIDRRSDVYSLGCVVYEMLAGEPPFSAATAKVVIAKHRYAPIPSLALVRPTVPSAVQAVLDVALAKIPGDRYATAGDFARALAAAMPTAAFGLTSSRANHSVLGPESAPAVAPARRSWWRWAAVGALVLAVTGAFVTRAFTRPSPDADNPMFDPRRIAVLYFDDLSPADLPTYIADGLTETLIDQLSSVPALHVISPAGVRPFRNHPIRVDSIARTLGVGTIVSGSVQRAGESIRLAVRLVDAVSGQQLYSETITSSWSRAFQIQDSLTTQIAFALRQRLGDVIAIRGGQGSTKSPQAWEAVQLASQAFQAAMASRRGGRDSRDANDLMLRADAQYARAESLDGRWPLPTFKRAGIARIIGEWNDIGSPPTARSTTLPPFPDTSTKLRWLSRALRFADDALRKGYDSAEVFSLRSYVLYQVALTGGRSSDSLFRAAEAGFQRAVNAKPHFASAWVGLANIYLHDGRFADAAQAAKEAYRADAFFEVRQTISKGFLASLYSQRFDESKTWCEAGLNRYPGDAQFAECQLRLLGWAAGKPDDVTRAWRELSDIEQRDSTGQLQASWAFRRFMVAAAIARAGLRDSALHVIERIHAEHPDVRGAERGRLEEAYVRLLLGDRDTALTLLEQHIALAPIARDLVSRSPWYTPLHGDARFEALVRRPP